MKKAIAILLVAIVALGCVFADVKTTVTSGTTDDLKVKYTVDSTNKLLWSASKIENPNDTLTDITEDSYDENTTYYATLITNSKSDVTLEVFGTGFVNDDSAIGNVITAEYTNESNAEVLVADSTSTKIGDKVESGATKELRVVSVPVTVAMDEATRDAAPAGSYTATLTATVSSI